MAHFALLWKARAIEKYRLKYEQEKINSIRLVQALSPKRTLFQRCSSYSSSTKKHITKKFRRWFPEGSALSNLYIYLRTDQTFPNFVLKSVLGFVGGIVMTYLIFMFFVFQLAISLIHATIMSCIIGVLLTLGLAFSYRVRCLVFLLIPQFFSRVGRYTLTCYALVLILTGPATNTLKNSEVLSESMACSQEHIKTSVKQIYESAQKPFDSMKDTINLMMDRVREVARRMKTALLKIHRLALSVVRVFQSSYGWLDSVVYACNKKLGTPYQRCTEALEKGVADCRAKLGPYAFWLCNMRSLTSICEAVRPLKWFCEFVDFGNGSIIATVKKKLQTFAERVNRMLYVSVHVHHSYSFTSNASHSASQLTAGIVTEIRSRADPLLTWLSWSSCVTSLFLLLIIFRAKYYQNMFETHSRYDNRYVTKELRHLDLQRMRQSRETILPLNRRERAKFVTTTSFRLVASEKLHLSRSAVFMTITTFKLLIHIVADYSLYWVLTIIRYHGRFESPFNAGQPDGGVQVSGDGLVASMLRSIIAALSLPIAYPATSSISCLPNPYPPDLQRYAQIGVLIVLLWFFALFEPYGLRLRHIIMGLYRPERAKCRAVWLYNHILRTRGSFLKFARRKLHREYKYSSEELLTFKHWVDTYIRCYWLRYLLGNRHEDPSCVLCGTTERWGEPETKLLSCETPKCPGVYCQSCFDDIGQLCTICLSPVDYGDLSDVSLEKGSSDDDSKSEDDADLESQALCRHSTSKNKQVPSSPEADDSDSSTANQIKEKTIYGSMRNKCDKVYYQKDMEHFGALTLSKQKSRNILSSSKIVYRPFDDHHSNYRRSRYRFLKRNQFWQENVQLLSKCSKLKQKLSLKWHFFSHRKYFLRNRFRYYNIYKIKKKFSVLKSLFGRKLRNCRRNRHLYCNSKYTFYKICPKNSKIYLNNIKKLRRRSRKCNIRKTKCNISSMFDNDEVLYDKYRKRDLQPHNNSKKQIPYNLVDSPTYVCSNNKPDNQIYSMASTDDAKALNCNSNNNQNVSPSKDLKAYLNNSCNKRVINTCWNKIKNNCALRTIFGVFQIRKSTVLYNKSNYKRRKKPVDDLKLINIKDSKNLVKPDSPNYKSCKRKKKLKDYNNVNQSYNNFTKNYDRQNRLTNYLLEAEWLKKEVIGRVISGNCSQNYFAELPSHQKKTIKCIDEASLQDLKEENNYLSDGINKPGSTQSKVLEENNKRPTETKMKQNKSRSCQWSKKGIETREAEVDVSNKTCTCATQYYDHHCRCIDREHQCFGKPSESLLHTSDSATISSITKTDFCHELKSESTRTSSISVLSKYSNNTDTTMCSRVTVEYVNEVVQQKRGYRSKARLFDIVTKANRSTETDRSTNRDASVATDWWSPILDDRKKIPDSLTSKNVGDYLNKDAEDDLIDFTNKETTRRQRNVTFKNQTDVIPTAAVPSNILSPSRYLLESQRHYNELFSPRPYFPMVPVTSDSEMRRKSQPSQLRQPFKSSVRTKKLEQSYSPYKRELKHSPRFVQPNFNWFSAAYQQARESTLDHGNYVRNGTITDHRKQTRLVVEDEDRRNHMYWNNAHHIRLRDSTPSDNISLDGQCNSASSF